MPSYYDEKTKTWYCKFYYTDYTGARKQKKKRGFKLQREAKEWERSYLERMQGTPDMTFQSLYEIYIDDMSNRLRQRTIDGKVNVCELHILPYFKDKPINEISPADIRSWQNGRIQAGYADGYLALMHGVLVTILNYAVKYYNLPTNPCRKAGKMGKPNKSLSFWTVDQYNATLTYVENIQTRTALQVLFYSGMRIGELLALALADLDFTNNLISVSKSLHQRTGGNLITPPKTENSVRVIAMPETIMAELKAYTEKIYGMAAGDTVFTIGKSGICKTIKRCSAAAGVPYIRIHDLRHSHVSLLIEMGFTPHLIAERIGDTVQMVNNIYGHLYPNKHTEVAEKLNTIIVPK